jgi:hypothetical protein
MSEATLQAVFREEANHLQDITARRVRSDQIHTEARKATQSPQEAVCKGVLPRVLLIAALLQAEAAHTAADRQVLHQEVHILQALLPQAHHQEEVPVAAEVADHLRAEDNFKTINQW